MLRSDTQAIPLPLRLRLCERLGVKRFTPALAPSIRSNTCHLSLPPRAERCAIANQRFCLGTPKRMTDDGGRLVWEAEHTPFGKAEVKLEDVTMNLRFPGQYADSETNTHYNYLRNYDPDLGRYITSDPIGLRGGVNSYAYVNSNPVSNSDPLGLYCVNNNGELTCEYPNGPKFTITLPDYNQGFPSFTDAQWLLHHDYDIARRVYPFTVFGCVTPERAMQAIIDRPVPGPEYSPATPEGTRNNAYVLITPNNMVTSYLTTDLNSGNPVVVNLADQVVPFIPGM